MIYVGVKEFRARLSELLNGDQPVVVQNHGRTLGMFSPAIKPVRLPNTDPAYRKAVMARLDVESAQWRAQTPDWREKLKAIGLEDEDIDPPAI